MRTFLATAMLLCLTMPKAMGAEALRPEKLAVLDSVVQDAIREGTIIGGALWVERDGRSHHGAFGHRALLPDREPMTEDTLFDVASITKVLATATAAMRCVDRGLVALDDPVAKHLPDFTGAGRDMVTIRHLLLHTSGLPVVLDPKSMPFGSHEEAIAQACRLVPAFEPGGGFCYSSVGSMLLAAVIERASGRRFDEFCTAEIFLPLGMRDTVFRPRGDQLCRAAPTSAPERGLVDDTVARLAGGVEGHASLFTTTADMARFARMMLRGGELDGARILEADTVALMTSVQTPPGLRSPAAANLPVKRGLGWDIDTPYRTPPHDYTLARGGLFPVGGYGHTGWTGQMLWIDPASRTFVIFLCNRYGGSSEDTRSAVYRLHHRISTLAAEAVVGAAWARPPAAAGTGSP